MAKLKDGFYKLTAEAVGSNSHILLAGGGSKALSDFATTSGVVTALGTNGNYVTWTKNGTANNLTVPYATNADTSNYINYTSRADKGNGTAQFCQYDGETDNPTKDLYSHIIMNHNNSNGYYTEIATCFHSDSVYFRRQHAGTTSEWKKFAWASDIPTVTNYYWANVPISATSDTTTTPTFGETTATYYLATQSMTFTTNGLSSDLTVANRGGLFANGVIFTSPGTRNDVGFIRISGTDETDTVLEIGTGDDGGTSTGESIVARLYRAGAVAKEAWLLDKSGNTQLPGQLILGGVTRDFTSYPEASTYKMGRDVGDVHFVGDLNNKGNSITWSYGHSIYADAGIYVKHHGDYGSKIYFATTNSWANGPIAAMEIDLYGNINALRSKFIGDLKGNINPFKDISWVSGTSTVKNIKDELVKAFSNIKTGVGANVIVPANAINYWNTESTIVKASNVYSMIKIGGGYEGTTYGLWLLSTYASNRIGYVGRDSNDWTPIYWLATTEDLKIFKNYSSVDKSPEGSEGWYRIAQILDNSGSACMFVIRAYAHSSVIFTVSKGYSTSGNITQLLYCSSGNKSYAYIKAARLLADGTVEILLNKGYVSISIAMYNADNIRPLDELTLDNGSPTVIQTLNFTDKAIVAPILVGTTQVTTPLVTNTDVLTLNGSKIYLKYNNTDTSSLVLSSTYFKPFDVANGKLDLGASDARWKGLYSGTGNFIGDITLYSVSGDSPRLIFQRGTLEDGIYDWDIYNTGGYLKLRCNPGTDSKESWTEILSLYLNTITSTLYITAPGFKKSDSSDSYVLLGGGGHKELSDFATASDYVKKAGDTMTGRLAMTNGGIIITTNTTSNYRTGVEFYKGTTEDATYSYDAQIGWHNTGGDGTGSICILPYATSTEPWGGAVGLFITETSLKYNNNKIWHAGNDGSGSGLDADTVDNLHASAFMRHRGWWNSKDSHSADGISTGIYFAYSNHGVPNHWGTLVTFAYQESAGYNLQLHGTGDNYLYYRNRSSDYGQKPWKRLADADEIPTVGNGTVTITQGGTTKGSFTMNQSGDTTIALTDNNTDTKNTAGSTNTSSKIFLIGATSLAANPQTYSHDTAYVGTDGCLYSNSTKVSVNGHTHTKSEITDFPTNLNQFTNGPGYITGITKTMVINALGYTPPETDTNTHYTTRIYAGASGTAGNAIATDPYLKVTDNDTYRNLVRFKGGGATTVKSDASGNITISSTDTNTNYYHTRVYSSGLKISTGTGVTDMYVPSGTTSSLGVVKQHTADDCTTYTSDEGATTPAAVKKAITTFVSIARNLTSGTKIGTITIGDTDTDLYCQTNTNTDTKVTQVNTTTSANYRVLLSGTADNTDRTETARKSADLVFNPSTKSLIVPTVYCSNILTLNGTNGIYIQYNGDNTKSLVLNGTAFKPFDTSNNKIMLGSTSARWSNTYSVLGDFSGQITSSVATGTSPFSVESTTVNTNLNADMLDGKHASAFATASHSHSYLPLSGGTLTGQLQINGSAASKPLVVRGIVGLDGTNGVAAELYLQYGANKAIMLGNTGSYNISADGSLYSGNAKTATNADKVDGCHASDFLRYEGWWTNGNGSNIDDALGMVFSYPSHGSPGSWGTTVTFEGTRGNDYKFQMHSTGYNNALYYRNRSYDRGGWTDWYRIIDEGNIASQSVNYADSAGSVAWANVTGKPPVLITVLNTCTINYNLENCLFSIGENSSYLMHISIRNDKFEGTCNCLLTYNFVTYDIVVLSKTGFTSFNSFKINTKRLTVSPKDLTLSFYLIEDSNPNHGSSIQMYVRLIELGEVRDNVTIFSSHNGNAWGVGGQTGTSFTIHSQ